MRRRRIDGGVRGPGVERGRAQPSGLVDVLGPPSAHDMDGHTFTIGSAEFLVLSFPLRPASSSGTAIGTGKLTEAEHAIMGHLIAGLSNDEIARSRGTSARTIANQITAIYRKMGVRSRRELAALIRRGPSRRA